MIEEFERHLRGTNLSENTVPRKHRKGFMEIIIHQGAAESLPRKCH